MAALSIPLSFEFFPPKTAEQQAQLERSLPAFKALNPQYVSVTFGAGGSTLSYTPETVRQLRENHGLDAAPHLSCMGGTRAEIASLLMSYRAMGCRRVVALRGDMPSGMATFGELRYASELVAFIREQHGQHFHVEVAAYPETHPQAEDARADLNHFIGKVRAGADGAITQYFYNADAYFRFVADLRARGIDTPVVPGIMPITQYAQLRRFSELCGAEIPRWIARRLQSMGDDADAIRAFGTDVVAELCQRLIDGGAPGLHFYTLNRSRGTLAVVERLR
ncbi:MAG: methylenetetrahydrofolate reductase [NAD(P)H] [Pseudomarimonas sp.]